MPEATPTCLESRFSSGVKGSAQDPNNGMTTSLPLGSAHGLHIFVVWPVGASLGIKRLWGIVSRPTRAQPWERVYVVCAQAHIYTCFNGGQQVANKSFCTRKH